MIEPASGVRELAREIDEMANYGFWYGFVRPLYTYFHITWITQTVLASVNASTP